MNVFAITVPKICPHTLKWKVSTMKTTVTRSQFHQAFESIRPDDFSYAGLDALFDYFSELEEDIGEELEFDVIAICCDFCEFDSMDDVCELYSTDVDGIYLNTNVIDFGKRVIIRSF